MHREKARVPVEFPFFELAFGVVSVDGKATAIGDWDDPFAKAPAQAGLARGLARTIPAALDHPVTACEGLDVGAPGALAARTPVRLHRTAAPPSMRSEARTAFFTSHRCHGV